MLKMKKISTGRRTKKIFKKRGEKEAIKKIKLKQDERQKREEERITK